MDNSEYINNANEIYAYFNSGMPEELAKSSTGTACIYIVPQFVPPNSPPTLTFPVFNENQAKKQVVEYQKQGYVFNKDNAKRIANPHLQNLIDGGKKLIEEILSIEFPTILEKMNTINLLGTALNNQVDQHKDVYGKKVNGIPEKLRLIELELKNNRLFNKYLNLNPYFVAIKHPQDKNKDKKRQELNGLRGTKITIDFFETVRKIFKWYYKETEGVVPKWDVLKSIKYSDFGIKYRFSYEKRW